MNGDKIALPMHKSYGDNSEVRIEDIGKVKNIHNTIFGGVSIISRNLAVKEDES